MAALTDITAYAGKVTIVNRNANKKSTKTISALNSQDSATGQDINYVFTALSDFYTSIIIAGGAGLTSLTAADCYIDSVTKTVKVDQAG